MNKTQINALKRIIAGAKSFPSLQGVFINADKRYCFCNSFMLVCLINEPPAEFPHVVGIDTERAMARHISHMPGKRLYPDLSKACELSKAKASYDFGKGLPAINPKYLIDMLRIFPDAEVYADSTTPDIKAVRFYSKDGEGYILPDGRK